MPQRTPGDEDSAQGSAKGKRSQQGAFRFPLGMARTQQMGNRGLAASSIGWTLAGCIIVGFAAGSWLDGRLGTQIWTPILFLLGVFAGFREMFRTLAQVTRAPRQQEQGQQATGSPTRIAASQSASTSRSGSTEFTEPQVLEAAQAPRQRIFSVPPPPFMDQPAGAVRAEPSAEDVKRLLLGELAEDELGGKERHDAI